MHYTGGCATSRWKCQQFRRYSNSSSRSTATSYSIFWQSVQVQVVPKHSSDGGCILRYIQILNVLIFWREHSKGIAFWRRFSYSKMAQYLMHSIIQARAFSAVRDSDVLFPNDFWEDLLKYITRVYVLAICSLSTERKRYWISPSAYPICWSVCVMVCLSGKCMWQNDLMTFVFHM